QPLLAKSPYDPAVPLVHIYVCEAVDALPIVAPGMGYSRNGNHWPLDGSANFHPEILALEVLIAYWQRWFHFTRLDDAARGQLGAVPVSRRLDHSNHSDTAHMA